MKKRIERDCEETTSDSRNWEVKVGLLRIFNGKLVVESGGLLAGIDRCGSDMISTRWLEKRKPYWTHLETLVDRAGRRGVRTLSHSELQELGLLYRQTASDLATVREDATSKQLAAYLNQLLGRAAQSGLHGRQKPKVSGLIGGFYRDTYPAIFRERLAADGAGDNHLVS